jgi:hypothetical protein
MELTEVGCEDGGHETGSGMYPVKDRSIYGIEPLGCLPARS